ncbi:hypothetical protein PWT90_09659 [Aphanocladium album]|nr:hypothetical protein PWT90_09659 [Aphanocladium album]
MSRRDHDAVARQSYPNDFRLRSPGQPHTYPSPYYNPTTTYAYVPSSIPPPSSILSGNGPPSHLASGGAKTFAPRSGTTTASTFPVADALQSVREISPPPLRRSQIRIESQTPMAKNTQAASAPSAHEAPRPQVATPPSRPSRSVVVPKQWNEADLADALQDLLKGVRQDHSRLVSQAIEATAPREWRVHHGADLFAGLGTGAVPESKGETMRVKFKQHLKIRKDTREEHYEVIPIETTNERVPRYRFHHVEIKKNVLTPNTMLTFVPHLRDLDSSEESKYNLWLKELEEIDTKSGFKPMNRERKVLLTTQTERAATVSLYLDTWLEKLGIANCTKSALVAYMASQESDDTITPQKKSDIIRSSRETADGDPISHDSKRAAALFSKAFKAAFDHKKRPDESRIELRRILLLEESVDGVLDPKPVAKDTSVVPEGDTDEITEAHLATYSILGCLICFSHSCDHGEYDNKNLKRTFSLSAVMPLAELLKQRRMLTAESSDAMQDILPCRRECYLLSPPVGQMREAKAWLEQETVLLKSIFSTLGQSKLQRDPICFAADILDRECSEVYSKFQSLAIKLPEATRPEPVRIKTLSWYDNRRKLLIGDWQDHTITHEHQRREIIEPCSHEGACTPQNCTCVKAGVLSEDIAQDDFVIEYVGELITHDEGVRREARRGDVFDEDSNISYVFTLLENEGIWVDAAIYGNLSRYINHASEHDRTGSNITPRILYVNGDYRIKFTALRDIRAGEELFFNYGENFPNLTKKLLDTKTGEKPAAPRKPGRSPHSAATNGVARKAPKPEQKKMEHQKPVGRRRRRRTAAHDDDGDENPAPFASPLNRPVKRKREVAREDSDDDGYTTHGKTTRSQWQESAAEDEDGLGEETTPSGGVRTRRSLRARASETPTKGDKAKAAGRRGGARPGSGRPRKHPRLVPKPATEANETVRRLRDSPKKIWRASLSESPRAARKTRDDDEESDEIRDSQECSTAGDDDGLKDYDGASQVEDDAEDEAGDVSESDEAEEDEDDEDVVVRKRMDRAARNRRPPAKFRGDEF